MPDELQTQMNKRNKLQKIITIAVFILLAVSILWGIFSGISYARSKITYENAFAVREALRYYREDQDAYPSAEQFAEQKILVPYYLEKMPVGKTTGKCEQYKDFVYSQSTSKDFKLQFCLTHKIKGLPAGVHQYTEQGLQ
jgi:type II secretory pathway pseudopilin PulG